MPWARIDDGIGDNPKTLKIWAEDPGALALDVRGIAYCAKHLTDGFVPAEIIALWFAGRDEERDRLTGILLRHGRWEAVPGGFEIHDYLEYNASKEKVLEVRAKRAKSGSNGGKKSGRTRRGE